MYRLGLMSANPSDDIGKLIALTACAGFFGVFFVIPLRKYYIVHQKLTFPTPAATVSHSRKLIISLQSDISAGLHYPLPSPRPGGSHRRQEEVARTPVLIHRSLHLEGC